MKLNIGGGYYRIPEFLNVDLCEAADIKHDLRLPLPLENDSVEEIIVIHVIESFYQWEFPEILKDWYRVLQPKGKITVEFTVLSKTIGLYVRGATPQIKQWGRWGLYGNQESPLDPIVLHHYVYERQELEQLFINTGFQILDITTKDIVHVPTRDLRIVATKL